MRLDAASAAAVPFVRSRSNGWNLNNNGNFNGNNNLNNNNRALSVANLTNAGRSVDSMVLLDELLETYFVARSNKRRSRDAVLFEMCFEKSLVRLCNDLNGRKLDTTPNYAFVVFSPKAREIFATAMYVRIVHHYLDRKLRPIYEDVLSDRTYNNRKGNGLHACIVRFREDVREMTCNYTRDAWIVHMDLKGYFPNADVEIALAQQLDIIDRYYIGDDEADIRYMMASCMRADPARNCKVYVPRSNWSAIAPEKSLFNKPVGTGGAIGFLCWQNAMGHYINNVVKWLETFGFLRVVVFVDDIYIVTTDKAKFFSMMPEIRQRLSALKVQLNERKFYCQHYSKGVHVLGSRVKFDREYADNGTVFRAFAKINEWKRARNVQWKTACLLSSMNTYAGILRTKDMRNVAERFRREVLTSFRRYLRWNDKKNCFALRERYGFRSVLQRKYKVRF